MKFDRQWPLDPPEQHNWGLNDNACWPSAIVPNDPGYVLLLNDKWYSTQPAARQSTAMYSRSPPAALMQQASARWIAAGNHKRSPDTLDLLQPEGNSTRGDTPGGNDHEFEIIQCIDGECYADDYGPDSPYYYPSMTPSTNIDTVPTGTPPVIVATKRSAISADLPVATAAFEVPVHGSGGLQAGTRREGPV